MKAEYAALKLISGAVAYVRISDIESVLPVDTGTEIRMRSGNDPFIVRQAPLNVAQQLGWLELSRV